MIDGKEDEIEESFLDSLILNNEVEKGLSGVLASEKKNNSGILLVKSQDGSSKI